MIQPPKFQIPIDPTTQCFMNIASLGLHKDELEAALSMIDIEFNIIAITETKLI